MINPTPLLRPSPMDISGLFAGSFEALKRRFGLFILLTLVPTILSLALFVAAAVVGGGAALARSQSAVITSVIIIIALVAVGTLVIGLAQLKVYGMMSQAAYEIAQGQQPDFKGLLARNRGYLPRLLPVIAIFFGALIAFYLVVGAVMWGLFSNISDSQDASAAALGALGLMTLLVVVAVPVSIVLWTKLLYLVPAVAIEQLGGLEAMKRSWSLTKGSFWRTFGYAVLPNLAVTAVLWVVNAISQLLGGFFTSAMPRNPTPGQAMAYLLGMIPLFTVTIVLQLVVQLFTTPFLQSYYTYMFVDQVRRGELPPQQYGYGQPSYGAPGPQPGQPYGQPEYPQQYPGQSQPYPPNPQYPGQQQSPGQQYPPQPGQPGPSQNQWPGQG